MMGTILLVRAAIYFVLTQLDLLKLNKIASRGARGVMVSWTAKITFCVIKKIGNRPTFSSIRSKLNGQQGGEV